MNPLNANSSQNGVATADNRNDRFLQGDAAGSSEHTRSEGGSELPLILLSPLDARAEGATDPSERQPGTIAQREHTGNADIPCWKRVLDLVCIGLTAPVWLPVMALVSAWTLLVSPGPLLFRQERVGYRGRRFVIFKFRTMHVNVETQSHESYVAALIKSDCPMTKLDCLDSRLIRGGRVLRALGFDELPQLFNVIRAEMSLVGPRPCTPREFQRYKPAEKKRVNAPPGLTGYWQVNGKNRTTFSEMIAMDILYSKNMSVWMDLAIMLRTAPAIALQVFESLSRKTATKIRPLLKDLPFGS
jgi:lipopolysaccharide/colanic/teichoic acid biosynthesis glycosyltransferase